MSYYIITKKSSQNWSIEDTVSFKTPLLALDYLAEHYSDDVESILFDIDGLQGDLMSFDEWISLCESGGFIDYDGYGELLDENYDLLHISAKCSEYRELRELTQPKHVLWFSK